MIVVVVVIVVVVDVVVVVVATVIIVVVVKPVLVRRGLVVHHRTCIYYTILQFDLNRILISNIKYLVCVLGSPLFGWNNAVSSGKYVV